MKKLRKKQKPRRGGVRVLKSKTVFSGPIFQVYSDVVKEPAGITVRRDVIRHPGSVVILVVDDSGRQPRVLLARQYRYAAGQRMWELPAGRIDEGESELRAAKRELLEETGYTATRWTRILKFWASPGFLDETMAIFMARGLRRGTAEPEGDEVIAKRFFPLPAAVRMAMNGTIQDGKTIAAVLWLDRKHSK